VLNWLDWLVLLQNLVNILLRQHCKALLLICIKSNHQQLFEINDFRLLQTAVAVIVPLDLSLEKRQS